MDHQPVEPAITSSYRIPFSNSEAWLAHLSAEGFVAITDVVSPEDCSRILNEMKQTLAKFSPKLDLNDEESWSISENYPPMSHGGMVSYLGHTKFQWELREKVAPIFSKVWNCEINDLATSFDGLAYYNGKRNYQPVDPLFYCHTDQAANKDYLWTVQGLINLCENGESDGGLVIVPKTHKIHQQFLWEVEMADIPQDWYKFTEEDKKKECFKDAIKLCLKPGDFVIWDSRTFHSYVPPRSQNQRAVTYICQVPKSHVSEEVRKMREMAWKDKRCTCHPPGEGFKLFPVFPKSGTPAMKDMILEVSVGEEDLSEIQKSLLCI